MENIIINPVCFGKVPPPLDTILPPAVAREAAETPLPCPAEEIRMSAGRRAFLRCGNENIALSAVVGAEEIAAFVDAVADHSLYAYADALKEGYLPLGDGIRVGVYGRASVEDGKIIGIGRITGVCVRLPHRVAMDVSLPLSLLGGTRGILLYSPPGGGKTTALREIARALASPPCPRRTVAVDTRGELGLSLSSQALCLDILSGYPKARGIEIATRTLDAEVIVCDEIGGGESAAILEAAGGGVPLVASAHAGDLRGLLGRPDIALLHRAGVFGAYLEVTRQGFANPVTREEADAL